MSCTLSADIITVAGLELALLGLVTFALYRDYKLPAFLDLKWVRRIRRPRTGPVPPPATATQPTLEKAVGVSGSHATPKAKRGELTMGLVTGGYATAVGASYAILESAYGLEGWQATCMAVNTLLLGYLFFFNGWWRNDVLIPLNRRIRWD